MIRRADAAIVTGGAQLYALAGRSAAGDWRGWAQEREARVFDLAAALASGPDAARAAGWSGEPTAQVFGGRDGRAPYDVEDGVALIGVRGLLVPSLGWIGSEYATGYAEIGMQVEAALADPDIRGIALVIDSGGGRVSGLLELGRKLRAARAEKPVAAIVSGAACSAAYWIAAQADSIALAPDGAIGSIGVIAMHVSVAGALEAYGVKVTILQAGARKSDFSPFKDLPESVAAEFTAELEEFRGQFADEVAAGRAGKFARAAAMATEARVYASPSRLAEAQGLGMFDALAFPGEALTAFQRAVAGTAANQGAG